MQQTDPVLKSDHLTVHLDVAGTRLRAERRGQKQSGAVQQETTVSAQSFSAIRREESLGIRTRREGAVGLNEAVTSFSS